MAVLDRWTARPGRWLALACLLGGSACGDDGASSGDSGSGDTALGETEGGSGSGDTEGSGSGGGTGDDCTEGSLGCPCAPEDTCNGELICKFGTCAPARCGDGVLDPGEDCDDENTDDSDSCPSTCQFARCGDGFVQAGSDEECDDGNDDDGDACLSDCTAARCGDGAVWAGVEDCDDENTDNTDACTNGCKAATCGDGIVWEGVEDCDDGNDVDGDGCDAGCLGVEVVARVVTGIGRHTCALTSRGNLRCWGRGENGKLGYGDLEGVGDDEFPSDAGNVDVGGRVIDVAIGGEHTCVVLDGGAVRCWGNNDFGQLGTGDTELVGDDELPSSVAPIDLGGNAVQVAAGRGHSCALMDDATVRCWGDNLWGQLGHATVMTVGDDEPPSDADPVDVGGDVAQVATGSNFTCALLNAGTIRCWGEPVEGQLGYGNGDVIGDNEAPASAGDMDLGGTAISIELGSDHGCATLDDGSVRCWGHGGSFRNGNAMAENVGDNEAPSTNPVLDLPGAVLSVGAGSAHTCVVLDGGAARCFGSSSNGQLGYGNTSTFSVGDVGDIDVGLPTVQITAGGSQTCALTDVDTVRCWGFGRNLGYGNLINIGDDEAPSTAGDVPVL